MNWTSLWNEFNAGNANAISAVSSLLSLVISIIGTILILVTFRAQLANNRSQQGINEVQSKINEQQMLLNKSMLERNRREIRPFFKLKKDFGWKEDYYNYSIELDNATAYLVKFHYVTNGRFIVSGEVEYNEEWLIGYSQMIRFQINSEGDFANVDMIYIQYEDEMGNHYKQNVFWDASLPHFTIPKLVVT